MRERHATSTGYVMTPYQQNLAATVADARWAGIAAASSSADEYDAMSYDEVRARLFEHFPDPQIRLAIFAHPNTPPAVRSTMASLSGSNVQLAALLLPEFWSDPGVAEASGRILVGMSAPDLVEVAGTPDCPYAARAGKVLATAYASWFEVWHDTEAAELLERQRRLIAATRRQRDALLGVTQQRPSAQP